MELLPPTIVCEEKFKKYTTPPDESKTKKYQAEILDPTQEKIKNMTNTQKWIYFLFEKDMRG